MNNDDLEQEYSKYGIDLAEIERIIAEYTGSTVYDSPTKKEDDTPSSTPVQPEEEASEKAAGMVLAYRVSLWAT